MGITVLDLEAIDQISKRADFSVGAESFMTSMDIQSIDVALRQMKDAVEDFGMLEKIPSYDFSGTITRPGQPESTRTPYSNPALFVDRHYPVKLLASGFDVDGYAILFITKPAPLKFDQVVSVWGCGPDDEKLIFSRGMPIETVSQLTSATVAKAFADYEAAQVAKAAKPGPAGPGSKRM